MIFANFSGGRDSSAMIVRWLELGNDLDYILFCDTKYEFKEMYVYVDKMDKYLQKRFNKKITRLSYDEDIFYKYAFELPINERSATRAGRLRGLPITLGRDYCTRELKINPSKNFIKDKCLNKFKAVVLIGYTSAEVERGRVSNLDYAIAKYPLSEWGWNEKECEAYLRKNGIANPLYKHFERTGCFLCPKQSKKAFYKLWRYYPKEWEFMKKWEAKAKTLNCVNQTFRIKESLLDLEKQFKNLSDELFTNEYIESETCFCQN